MNFGILLMMEFARFTRLLGSKSTTISPGKLFTPTFSMPDQFEFLSWATDPSTEVSNGSMFLDHSAKLEFLPRLGLKTSTLTPGCTANLLTWAPSHAVSVTISLTLKIFCEKPSRDLSRKIVTRSFPMTIVSRTAGLKRIGIIDSLQILSIRLVSSYGLPLGSTCLLESRIVSTC